MELFMLRTLKEEEEDEDEEKQPVQLLAPRGDNGPNIVRLLAIGALG
jgi:hypothetical protein